MMKSEAINGTVISGIDPNRVDHSLARSREHHPVTHVDQRDDYHELARAGQDKSILGSNLLPICTDSTGRRVRHHAMACEIRMQHVLFGVSASSCARIPQFNSGEPLHGSLTLQMVTSVASVLVSHIKAVTDQLLEWCVPVNGKRRRGSE